jgi:hypothetical protein
LLSTLIIGSPCRRKGNARSIVESSDSPLEALIG